MPLPRIWTICCRQLPERAEMCRAHLKAASVNPQVWWGIHAATFGLQATRLYRKPDNSLYRVPVGHVGRILSHYMLWQHLHISSSESVGDEWLVLEDDAVLCSGFAELWPSFREALPNGWRVAFVGWIRQGGMMPEYLNLRVNRVRNVYPWGTHAYLLHREALPVLLDTMHHATINIDQQLAECALPKLRTYIFTPSLVSQRTHSGEWPTSCGDGT